MGGHGPGPEVVAWVSWVALFLALIGYSFGSVLQAIGARRTAHVAGLSAMAFIVVELPYLAGLAVDGLAFGLKVVALQALPLFVVQSILAGVVGVTAIIAHLHGDRLHGRDWGALGALALGLVLVSVTAETHPAVRIAPEIQLTIVVSIVIPIVVGLVALRMSSRYASLVLAAGAGLAWSGVAIASRGISGAPAGWYLLQLPLTWAIVAHGIVGLVCFALALRRGAVAMMNAVIFVLEMIIPSAVGLWLFGDSVAPGAEVWAGIGFALAVGGTISLIITRHQLHV
jgi:hypothetical protein